MRFFMSLFMVAVVVFAGFGLQYASAHEKDVFLRSKKQTEALESQSKTTTQNRAPIVRQNTQKQALRQPAPSSVAPPNFVNPVNAPCTKADMAAYAKIQQAMNSAFVIDDDNLSDHSKLKDAEDERFRSAQKIVNFVNDPEKGKAYALLMARCGTPEN